MGTVLAFTGVAVALNSTGLRDVPMRKPRCEVIDPNEVNAVHVCSRTVRRCRLFGKDELTGKNYDHRKGWIEAKLQRFAAWFGIDLIAYSVLSNHFHLVLRNRPDVVAGWDDTEVARRWLMICPHRKDKQGNPLEPTGAELDTIRNCPERLAEIRSRLADISWWMRLLCQRIATRCNQEDEARGRFFEERYRATRLLDEASLIACAAYVDLNPVRAALAETVESSDHTSAQRRAEALRAAEANGQAKPGQDRPKADVVEPLRQGDDRFLSPLVPEAGLESLPGPDPSQLADRCSDKPGFGMSTVDYLDLLDWTARQVRPDKPGYTPGDLPPIVARLGLSGEAWSELVGSFGRLFHLVAGRPESIDRHRSSRSHSRFRVRPRLRQLLG